MVLLAAGAAACGGARAAANSGPQPAQPATEKSEFEAIYRARYETHNAAVREHFRDRPADLLELDITAGQGWERDLGRKGENEND